MLLAEWLVLFCDQLQLGGVVGVLAQRQPQRAHMLTPPLLTLSRRQPMRAVLGAPVTADSCLPVEDNVGWLELLAASTNGHQHQQQQLNQNKLPQITICLSCAPMVLIMCVRR